MVDQFSKRYHVTHEVDADRNAWMTPPALFAKWHAEYNFTVDACASPWNAQLIRYWSIKDNGLAQSWEGERVWCNPPYGRKLLRPWVDKALQSQAEVAVLLLPSRTGQQWFHDLNSSSRVTLHFLRGRVKFLPPEHCKVFGSPTEDSVIAVVRKC